MDLEAGKREDDERERSERKKSGKDGKKEI